MILLVFFSGIKPTKTDLMQWKLSAILYISVKIHDFQRYYGEWFEKENKNKKKNKNEKMERNEKKKLYQISPEDRPNVVEVKCHTIYISGKIYNFKRYDG